MSLSGTSTPPTGPLQWAHSWEAAEGMVRCMQSLGQFMLEMGHSSEA